MYLADLSQQLRLFLFSVSLGFSLGILYDLFRIVRILFFKEVRKTALFVQDVFYILLCCVISFLFLLSENYGELRGYVFIGEIIGFFIYYFSFGVLTVRFSDASAKLFHRFFSFIKRLILRPIRVLTAGFSRLKDKTSKNKVQNQKKFQNYFKIRLQQDGGLLYNLNEKFYLCSTKRKKMKEHETEEGEKKA